MHIFIGIFCNILIVVDAGVCVLKISGAEGFSSTISLKTLRVNATHSAVEVVIEFGIHLSITLLGITLCSLRLYH